MIVKKTEVAAKAVLQSHFSVKCLTRFIKEFKCNSNSLDNLKVATNYTFFNVLFVIIKYSCNQA